MKNKPGAGGNIGTQQVAKTAPDGYTLLMGTNGTHGKQEVAAVRERLVAAQGTERGIGFSIASRFAAEGADSVRNGLVVHAAYNAAMGGVHGLTTGLAREFA